MAKKSVNKNDNQGKKKSESKRGITFQNKIVGVHDDNNITT
jgi:hypothetical protein